MIEPISILIVDDHQLVRQGVRDFLETQPDLTVIGEAGTGDEAIRFTEQNIPDVILMDLVMPGGIDGVEATRKVKKISPRTQVVILTSYHDDEHIFPAIQAGALSYILKDIGAVELADVVRKAAQGEAVLNPSVAARLVQESPEGEAAWALGEVIAPVEKRLNRSARPSPSAQEHQNELPSSPHEAQGEDLKVGS